MNSQSNVNDSNGNGADVATAADAVDATPAPQSPSEMDVLREEVKNHQNKYLYLYADFENYKKRAIKERSDVLKFGHEAMLRDLLQVSDNLERAIEASNNQSDALASGVKMVHQQLVETLKKFGATTIESVGQKFNPETHEAVGQEKSDQEEGTVIREHQKGYTLHGRLLRPARVSIASK